MDYPERIELLKQEYRRFVQMQKEQADTFDHKIQVVISELGLDDQAQDLANYIMSED